MEHVNYGLDLTRRGALFSARKEFVAALEAIAHAKDAAGATRKHIRALNEGLVALEEAAELAEHSAPGAIEWQRLVARHRTPALEGQPVDRMHPYAALQAYYSYAQQRLLVATDREPAASRALYGIARVELTEQGVGGSADGQSGPQALVLHQTALMADPMNHRAANELGVLLGRYGQLARAREAFSHSVAIRPDAENLRNLARVQHMLGNSGAADVAHRQATQIAAWAGDRRPADPQAAINFVDPATFASMNGPADVPVGSRPAPAVNPQAAPQPQQRPAPPQNVFERLGLNLPGLTQPTTRR